jgi:hypothetical protein
MRANPKKLNALQLKTLAILQALAAERHFASGPDEAGKVAITGLPHLHGNHFHIGRAIVRAKDASGLRNPNVYSALKRKGLIEEGTNGRPVLTAEALAYETGVADQVFSDSAH